METFENANGVNSYATSALVREAAAWARRAGHDSASALGFGRWYVRFTDGEMPLALALANFNQEG